MLFAQADIKMINKMVACSNKEDFEEAIGIMKTKQASFFYVIEEIKNDPRCFEAYKYCMNFCGIAIDMAESMRSCKFIELPQGIITDTKSLIAQEKHTKDKRAGKIVSQFTKLILNKLKFDEDDTFWLKLTIGAFLILTEKYDEDKLDDIESLFRLL